MIQVTLIVASAYFRQHNLFRYLIYWYIWFIIILNYYIGIVSNRVVLVKSLSSHYSLLTSPKCYKASQRSIWLNTKHYVIYSNFKYTPFYINIINFKNYIKFFNLFLMCYNSRPIYIKFVLNSYILDIKSIVNKVICCLVLFV